MKDWQSYWQEAMNKFGDGDRRFFPGDSDDLQVHWPGRDRDMVAFYYPEAQRHLKTLHDNAYPAHRKELGILIELALARANMNLTQVRPENEMAANEVPLAVLVPA